MAQPIITAYSQPLSVVGLACAEQCFHRVIARNKKASKVDKELSGDVEEDQKEVNPNEAEESVNFRHGGLLLEVVEHVIFGELPR